MSVFVKVRTRTALQEEPMEERGSERDNGRARNPKTVCGTVI
jgi:hypothetical protein